MKPSAILKTAVTVWSTEDQCYVTQSPLADTICGAGDTVEESQSEFEKSLEINYEHYKAGTHAVYSHPGRPAKGKKKFAVEVAPDVQEAIAAFAKDVGISQGEAVECFYLFFSKFQRKGA
jgi:predicted HicB family RNase H-like nuclease